MFRILDISNIGSFYLLEYPRASEISSIGRKRKSYIVIIDKFVNSNGQWLFVGNDLLTTCYSVHSSQNCDLLTYLLTFPFVPPGSVCCEAATDQKLAGPGSVRAHSGKR